MSKVDKLITKNSVTFDDNEINLLFTYLVTIQHENLRSILTQDIFTVDSSTLIEPLEFIDINIVFDHIKTDHYYFQASFIPSFSLNSGYSKLDVDFNHFFHVLYQDQNKLIIDENRTIEKSNASLILTYSYFASNHHKMLKLEDYGSFKSSLLNFVKFIYTVIDLIIPGYNLVIILNLPKINAIQEHCFKNNHSLKSTKQPESLQRVLKKAKKTIYYPVIPSDNSSNSFACLKINKAVDYSVNKNNKMPLALKKVLANVK